ncbi:MAG: outer membrane beta-barrel domain-containing protein [Bacteriovoracaceae bacterium]|nr:outer membrane beta-barrel domain-containing protein [Bacteriovoracaceae bacterium]
MHSLHFRNIVALSLTLISLSAPALRADEKDLYDFLWLDPDKKVYVLQNKVHKKDKTFFLNVGYGQGMSSNFQDTSMLHTNFGFNITEEWAIEGLYSKYSNSNNEAYTNLSQINGQVPFIRKTLSNYGILAKWSPFYGKINTFNKIFYFDWNLAAGFGKINTQSNAKTVANLNISANNYSDESYSSVIAKTGFSFHVNKNIHVGIDLIMNNYSAPGPTRNGVVPANKMRSNMDSVITLGVSF